MAVEVRLWLVDQITGDFCSLKQTRSPLPAISLVYKITSESYHLQADGIWSRKPPVPTKFDIISIYKTFWVHTNAKEIFYIIKFFTIENKRVLNWRIFRNCTGKESLAILHIALHIAYWLSHISHTTGIVTDVKKQDFAWLRLPE